MIVARIASAAEAVLKAFSDTKTMDLLARSITLSANRGNYQEPQYQHEVNLLRVEAKKIIDTNFIQVFPKDMADLLQSSGYAPALPGNIAKIIYRGLSTSKTATISSSELLIYQEAAQSLQSELANMLISFKKLKFDRIVVPEDMISIDILIPRDSVENDLYYFLSVNKAFADIVSAFQQLMGLPREPPKLVYSSTTDLVTGITIAIVALTPFLKFYNKLLDAAQKHIDILQGLKTLKSLPLKVEQDFSDQAEEARRSLIDKAIEQSVNDANSPLADKGIVSELSNLITIKSRVVVNAITNGARVGITVESLVSLPKNFEDYDPIKAIIEENAKLGISVADRLKILGEPVPLSITDASIKTAD